MQQIGPVFSVGSGSVPVRSPPIDEGLGMIFICSRGRPRSLERFFTASTPQLEGKVLIDEDDDSYDLFKLPKHWKFFMGPRDSTTNILNRAYRHFPEEPFYAVVCDDMIYETPNWDITLSRACGNYFLAWGDDGRKGDTLCTSFFVGGKLVRKMGWLMHPEFGHLYVDQLWWEIAQGSGLAKYTPEIKFRHYKIGDRTYYERRIRGDASTYARVKEQELPGLIEKAKSVLRSEDVPILSS